MAGAVALILVATSGCGSSEHASTGATHSRRATANRDSATQGPALGNMVSAVSAGKSSATIDLKFELLGRPVVGQPVDINFALIPGHELDRMSAVFHAADGLELTQGEKTEIIDHPEVGVAVTHTITIVPQRDGIFYLTAVVLADSPTDSLTRTFSIPVIAGAGLATSGPITATGQQAGSQGISPH
jgi:hypothetical protein